ncbi:MAG: ABC transporter permease [Clostridia bacterium]
MKRHFYSIFIRWWFAAKMALDGILANPLRSALTILGVAIGVTSVVSLMGIGEGARRAVVEQFESLGSNVIAIKAHQSVAEFQSDYPEQLVERVNGLQVATPVVHADTLMRWRRTRENIGIIGVNNRFPEVRDHKLIAGRFFTGVHVNQRAPVAVLGYNVGMRLMGGRNVLGYKIVLNGQTYTIMGVLSAKGKGNADDIDNKVVIPYTAAQKIAEKRTVEEIWIKAASPEVVDLAVAQLSRIIKVSLGVDQKSPSDGGGQDSIGISTADMGMNVGMIDQRIMEKRMGSRNQTAKEEDPKTPEPNKKEDLVTITNLNQMVNEADNANRVMTLLLGGIAAVSLLVGGLGIMNIMMVAVNERIEEIGVRRAMGAKQSDLLLQFILEALYVSFIGSVVGIVAGIWGLKLFENIGFQTAVSLKAIRIATVVAMISGLLFGVYPAVSASSVPPIEALRRQ